MLLVTERVVIVMSTIAGRKDARRRSGRSAVLRRGESHCQLRTSPNAPTGR